MAIATGLLSPAVVAGMTGGGGITDGLLATKRPLYARLYDRIVPGSGEDDSDADKVAAFRQGLLGLAAGMAQTGGQGFMGALGTGLATGLEQLNAGRDSMANARYKQMLMASQGGDPAGLREFNELTRIASDPNETPDRRQAASVRLGMTGRASSAGYSLVKFTGADGRPRVGTLNGQTGRIDTPDGLSFSPSAVQITGMGEQGYAPDAPTQRAANGEPVRIDPSVPAWLRDQILANPDGGEYHQPDAGTFTPAPAIPRTTNPSAWAGPTAAEEAAAKARAEAEVGLAYSGARGAAEASAAGAKERAIQDVKPTKAQESVDDEYGKEYVTFIQGGAADGEKAITELQDALAALSSERNITGPWVGSVPMAARSRINPRSVAVQEAVESTVQRSLRAILGAQFTASEGERIISRAYNPLQSEAENSKRVSALLKQLRQGFENKAAMSRYYEENGTLRGFSGKIPSIADFGGDSGSSAPAPRKRTATDDLVDKWSR